MRAPDFTHAFARQVATLSHLTGASRLQLQRGEHNVAMSCLSHQRPDLDESAHEVQQARETARVQGTRLAQHRTLGDDDPGSSNKRCSVMAGEIFYTSEVDYSGGGLTDFIDWFAGRHAADLFKSGFYTCACYTALEGEYTIIDTYQAHTWDVFLSPGYKARDKDPYAKARVSPKKRGDNTVWAYSALSTDIAGNPLQPIDSDWISFLRFEADAASEKAVAEWLQAHEIPRLRAQGAGVVRLVHRTKDRPIGDRSTRPRCAILTEWERKPPSLADLLKGLSGQLRRELTAADGFVGVRVYPWPDHPELR